MAEAQSFSRLGSSPLGSWVVFLGVGEFQEDGEVGGGPEPIVLEGISTLVGLDPWGQENVGTG